MNLNIRVFLCVLLAVAGEAGACVGSAVALNPLNSTRLPLAGNGAISFAVELSLDCAAGESFSITPAAATFTTSVGSSAYSLQGVFYADAALTQALHSNPINHTMGAGGTVVTPVYGVLQGESGLFQGMGPYSLEMPLLVTSSAGSPLTLTHLESGNVQGTCSISNPTVDFGIVSNTANPVHAATLSLNCTQGLSWSLSQSALAAISIGNSSNNTGWIYANADATSPLISVPIISSGTGMVQDVNLFVGLSGGTQGSSISGTGLISGVIPIVVSY